MNEASPHPRRVEQMLVGDLQAAAAVACVAVGRGAVSVTIGQERCPAGAVRVVIVWPAGAEQVLAGGTDADRSPAAGRRSGPPRSARSQ